MRVRDIILPEDKTFFDLFEQMAEKIQEGAELLANITADLSQGPQNCRQIRQIEHNADGVTRQIYERLNQSLITPLEPEEISRLAPVLDDIIDKTDWVAQQLCNYGITETNESLKEFSRLILICASQITRGITLLRTMQNSRELQEVSIEINQIWNLSTDLLSKAILELFSSGDPIMIIKLKDIYESMEKVLEKCNDFGHVLNDIAIAHS
jgi:uncharacterized protein Yka (UPF0111/DUF47 family)